MKMIPRDPVRSLSTLTGCMYVCHVCSFSLGPDLKLKKSVFRTAPQDMESREKSLNEILHGMETS